MALFVLLTAVLLTACKQNSSQPDPAPDFFQLVKASAEDRTLSAGQTVTDISVFPVFRIEFSAAVDTQAARNNITLLRSEGDSPLSLLYSYEDDNRDVILSVSDSLEWDTEYSLIISEDMRSSQGAEFAGTVFNFQTRNGEIELVSASVNEKDLMTASIPRDISFDEVTIELTFSRAVDENSYQSFISLSPFAPVDYALSADRRSVTITNSAALGYYRHYSVNISSGFTAENGFEFSGFGAGFQTGLNPADKFPRLSDEQLLMRVQEATFGYFWNFAHPVSGVARERNNSGDVVTTGGSGFGLMAILTGIERGFISRAEGVNRLGKIISFLASADRFHGAWPHWMNGATGEVIPFSTQDNGADLVETAFMAQGLIAVREYLNEAVSEENNLRNEINDLLDAIEWSWFTRGGQNVLYWHWSPNYEWAMNHQIRGYNEALIVYILAASSADYSIEPEVYHEGWAQSGGIRNGNIFYNYTLPVGFDYGGPLFFSHYSFLGLNPQNLTDSYANYQTQNRNHSLINRAHSINNPGNYVGYSEDSWGLTASDDPGGYGVHEPTRDNGTITPTAAISSIPYTPDESMDAIRHFYYILGDKLWGEYGFYDAFNPTQGWWGNSYLAIDQGPIIIMIENYRSGLLWDLFMSAPEVQAALDELGFNYQQ